MRTEEELMQLLLTTAREDERIRGVVLNGSRANPETKKDDYQDYDIVYLVAEIASFKKDFNWIDRFGKRMILQMPNSYPEDVTATQGLVYLMQFQDGNRIDLTLCTMQQFQYRKDIDVVLMDKDHAFSYQKRNMDIYHVKKPTQMEFEVCCNEYWWLNPYVAKGIARDEITYVKFYMENHLRSECIRMLSWYCGFQQEFTISTGKMGKYLKDYLPMNMWQLFESTYVGSSYEEIWTSLWTMNELFETTAQYLAKKFHYPYPAYDAQAVMRYLQTIRAKTK